MPASVPDTVSDEPEGGWPWQLGWGELYWVIEVGGKENKPTYKVKCKCCGWCSKSHTTPWRCAVHFRGEKGEIAN